jgi:UDP-3-O-[3-hydroxymyristoyl] glucosamine N-acyltransferase
MKFSASKIAELLKGEIDGNPEITITKLSKIEEGESGSLSFLANPKYTHFIYSTKASVVIVSKEFIPQKQIHSTLIRVENVEFAFAKLLELYNQIKNNKTGISKQCYIDATAKTGENIYVGEFAFIGENAVIGNNVKIFPQVYIGDNVTIGDNTIIFAGVKVYSETVIGKNCILHAGVVLGSDGFRFDPQNKENVKVAQIGNVVLEDDVEIGANCAIDRATLGSTILRKGVKFDNLIHIAHNVEIGENSYIAAASVIAGSTKIGRGCMLSGQVGIVGHLDIAEGTIIAPQSGISKNITQKGKGWMGSPAFEEREYKKSYIHFRNFQNIVSRLDKLEKEKK